MSKAVLGSQAGQESNSSLLSPTLRCRILPLLQLSEHQQQTPDIKQHSVFTQLLLCQQNIASSPKTLPCCLPLLGRASCLTSYSLGALTSGLTFPWWRCPECVWESVSASWEVRLSQPVGRELPKVAQCLGTRNWTAVSGPGQPTKLGLSASFNKYYFLTHSTYYVSGISLGIESDKQNPCPLRA